MEETSHTKKLEVAQHYLLGGTYRQIEEETGVSHGSIANIIRGIENSKLTIPGTPLDQVNDLRQLSVDLKKKGLLQLTGIHSVSGRRIRSRCAYPSPPCGAPA